MTVQSNISMKKCSAALDLETEAAVRRDMLENQRRLEKMGAPRTKMAASEFSRLTDASLEKKYLPTWVGSCLEEYHRGTYTSMARNKNITDVLVLIRMKRCSILDQQLLQQFLSKNLKKGWEVILRNQFDILFGIFIKKVYDDSKKNERLTTFSKKWLVKTLALLPNL